MAKLTAFSDFGKITDPDEFQRFASGFLIEAQSILNGKIEFDSNIPSQTKVVYFPSANVDLGIDHTLNKTNVGYLLAQKTLSCDVYNGATASTNSKVYLRSTTSGVTVTLILY